MDAQHTVLIDRMEMARCAHARENKFVFAYYPPPSQEFVHMSIKP